MHLHGGEPSTPLNTRYLERLLPELGPERIDILTNGLGDADAYKRIIGAARQVHRVGFTYHRRMIGVDGVATEKFLSNVLRVRDMGALVYVKELLFLDLKAQTLEAQAWWKAEGIEFKIQDFKGTVRGEDFAELTRYTAADMALLSPEYVHEGAECACLRGYKNVIIRGGWRSGDVLACWIDPCVVGNIGDCTYNPSARVTLDRAKGTVVVTGVPQVYRGTYARDRYYEDKKARDDTQTKEAVVAEQQQQGVRVTVDQVEVAIGRGHADVQRMVSSLCDECRAAQAEVKRLRTELEKVGSPTRVADIPPPPPGPEPRLVKEGEIIPRKK
jgi:hypothetical protein